MTPRSRDDPRAVAEFLSQLGRCHRQLGGLEVARDLFGQALALRRGLDEAKNLQAESQADLAGLLAAEGRYEEAIAATRAALALLRESGGDRNALGVEIWRELGSLYRSIGDAMESEASYRQALEIALNRFGPNHPASTGVQRPLGRMLIEVIWHGLRSKGLAPAERAGPPPDLTRPCAHQRQRARPGRRPRVSAGPQQQELDRENRCMRQQDEQGDGSARRRAPSEARTPPPPRRGQRQQGEEQDSKQAGEHP